MKKVVACMVCCLFLSSPYGAFADQGNNAQALQEQIKMLQQQNQDMGDLKNQMQQLMDMVNNLQKENAATREYAKSLENKIQAMESGKPSAAPVQVQVPGVATECAATSCRTYLNEIGNLRMGMLATGVIGHVGSREGNENEMASGSTNLYLEAPLASNTVFHLNIEGIGGNWDINRSSLMSLNADAGSLSTTTSSGNEIDPVQIREAKLQATFFDDKLTTYVGKIDPTAYFDGNEVANNENSQFLASGLVNNPTFTAMFAGYVPGAGLNYDLDSIMKGVSVGTGLFSRDNSGNHIGDSLFWISELDYATELFGRAGNYRVYGYVASLQGTSVEGDWTYADDDAGMGMGISADQYITKRISIFGRVGHNGNDLAAGDFSTDAADRSAVANDALSCGWQLENPLYNLGLDRGEDVFGMGYANLHLFDNSNDETGVGADSEHIIELYYRVQVNPQISVSPFYQFAQQLGGDRDGDRISVTGLRSSVEF